MYTSVSNGPALPRRVVLWVGRTSLVTFLIYRSVYITWFAVQGRLLMARGESVQLPLSFPLTVPVLCETHCVSLGGVVVV